MDFSDLKPYARKARRDFIAAVTERAQQYGIAANGIEEANLRGDVLIVGARVFPASIAQARQSLADRVSRDGFAQVMDEIAYTWFNRFVAIRFMELHGYLEHGVRVLSHPTGHLEPESLQRLTDITLPDLDFARAIELKLDGTKDAELYEMLLLAQCKALHRVIPSLFDDPNGYIGLLLPANLLHSDSIMRRLVQDIHEKAWTEIEIIGWLYQFYISERKDEVMSKVVRTADIPAATQLFTPNWIVKYLVQNSLGALWMKSSEHSRLDDSMPYYIGITPPPYTYEKHKYNPENITLIDPACGSGHILLEAYDRLRDIYMEHGYRKQDLALLILQNNLYGLDIDQRATQLAVFCLIMKGRADDAQLFTKNPCLNILSFTDSHDLQEVIDSERTLQTDSKILTRLVACFTHATTYGSLIHIPKKLVGQLRGLRDRVDALQQTSGFLVSDSARRINLLIQQAELLARRYDVVVANPPYMGNDKMNPVLKAFIRRTYPETKRDLFSCFIERSYSLAKEGGFSALVTLHNWMFTASFKRMRKTLLHSCTIQSLAHLGPRAFKSISGEVVQTAAFVLKNEPPRDHIPVFLRLVGGNADDKRQAFLSGEHRFSNTSQRGFEALPNHPVFYWINPKLNALYDQGTRLANLVEARIGLVTGDNERFLRRWWEVDSIQIGPGIRSNKEAAASDLKWFPCNKGGPAPSRKWYGPIRYLINWQHNGQDLREFRRGRGESPVIPNTEYYFRESLSWSDVGTGPKFFRLYSHGFIHNNVGHSAFNFDRINRTFLAGYCNTCIVQFIVNAINPTLHFGIQDFGSIPFRTDAPSPMRSAVERNVRRLVALSRSDWDAYEVSWDFKINPLVRIAHESEQSLEACFLAWEQQCQQAIAETKKFEEENNQLFIDAYALTEGFSPEVPEEEVSLKCNPLFRHGRTKRGSQARFRQDTMEELVSYAIGCIMGRYSLDRPGLVYAHSQGQSFDSQLYTRFAADDDGIVPITPEPYFDDDVVARVTEFLEIIWGKEHLAKSMESLTQGLPPARSISGTEKLRTYMLRHFFSFHRKTYEGRPIYWLFTSGKARAFQCLVYIHRYNRSTLARMRTRYVIPLQGIIASRMRQLDSDIQASSFPRHRKRLEKAHAKLAIQENELRAFDNLLRYHADQRHQLDLDKGVRANYAILRPLLTKM